MRVREREREERLNDICFNNSLVATIKKERPDLLPNLEFDEAKLILGEPPPAALDKQQQFLIPDIGEPSTAGFFTLSAVDPSSWYSHRLFLSS